ncbi:MAG: M56 family metallopeptidase [Clostridia bacterium]|nr:M56 family metallopeptidase [Clostridia bacterium]
MIDGFIYFSNLISPMFYKIVYMSIVGSILGMTILCITKLFDSKLSAKTKCFMWLIPLLFLMMPVNRIQITTTKDLGIASVMTKLENSLNDVPMAQEMNMQLGSEQIKNDSINTSVLEKEENTENSKISGTNQTITIYEILPILWVLGMSMSAIMLLLGNILLNRRVNQALKLEDSTVRLILMKCKRRLQITKKIEIRLHSRNVSPCIYGIRTPKILVSEEFLQNSSEVIENVFLHELSHYKRKDMLTNYILLMMTAIHWFNPLVYGFFKKIRQEMELATDEIALSRMEEQEKKQYGRTLIDLLQTYETEKVATKLLCMTDDNKNMERRIRKIKLSTKLKQYKLSILVFTMVMVLGIASMFVLKPTSFASTNEHEKELYKIVKEYLIKQEQQNHESIEKKRETTDDDFQTFIDMKELGIKKEKDETHVYVWAIIQSYYVQEELTSTGSSMPYKFIIRNNEIVDYEIPKDGAQYQKTLETIFPEDIREKMQNIQTSSDSQMLEKQAQKYYQYLDNESSDINVKSASTKGNYTENMEIVHVSKLAGKWKPYMAQDKDGNEINLRDIYGSGISTYGGELVIKQNGTYTEWIGVYSEEEIDRFTGICEVYGNGEKGMLISNQGETKTIQIIQNGINSLEVLKVTNEEGISIYFSK